MNVFRKNDVAIYCSKSDDCLITIEEQQKRLKKYCKHLGIDIVKEYIEVDNINKPMFYQMIKDIDSKEFNIVLSYNFDTLTTNKDELFNLVNKLNEYYYELQLECSYIYKPIDKRLFLLPRDDEAEIKKHNEPKSKKRKATCYPLFDYVEIKNPKSDKPYNWVELLQDERTKFDLQPIFDTNGNYLGTTTEAYVFFKEIIGFGKIKSSKEEQAKKEKEETTLKQRKLSDIFEEMKKNEVLKNEQ